MFYRVSPEIRKLSQFDGNPVEIGHGAQAMVCLHPTSNLVCKRFTAGDLAERRAQAQREHDYLQRLWQALADEEYLRCPKPIRLDVELGRVWMTNCPGAPLDHLLASSEADIDEHLEHIADLIQRGVARYIAEFNEPFYSLSPLNMVFDTTSSRLYLLDLASMSREGLRVFGEQEYALEITMGKLVGAMVYESVRPGMLRNRRYWERQRQVAHAVLAKVAGEKPLSSSRVRSVCDVVYGSLGKKGSRARRLWYGTLAQLVFKRRSTAILAAMSRTGNSLDNDLTFQEL